MYQEIFNEISQQLKSIAGGVNNTWTVWVSLLGVFVALLLGVIGIFQDWIRKKILLRPSLRVEFRLNPPDSHKTHFRTKSGEFSNFTYYLKARVVNNGNCQLEDVEAMVLELSKKEANGQFKPIEDFLPLNLKWSISHEVTKLKIQPGLFKFLDFGHISETRYERLSDFNLSSAAKVILALDVEMAPNTGSHLIFPGEYRIKIVFAANNLKPIIKIYSLVLVDKWTDNSKEMLENNISIKEESYV